MVNEIRNKELSVKYHDKCVAALLDDMNFMRIYSLILENSDPVIEDKSIYASMCVDACISGADDEKILGLYDISETLVVQAIVTEALVMMCGELGEGIKEAYDSFYEQLEMEVERNND